MERENVSRRDFLLKALKTGVGTIGLITAPQLIACFPSETPVNASGSEKTCGVKTTQYFDAEANVTQTVVVGPKYFSGSLDSTRTFEPTTATQAGPNVAITVFEKLPEESCNK